MFWLRNKKNNFLVCTLYYGHAVYAVLILCGRFEICLEPSKYLNSLPKWNKKNIFPHNDVKFLILYILNPERSGSSDSMLILRSSGP